MVTSRGHLTDGVARRGEYSSLRTSDCRHDPRKLVSRSTRIVFSERRSRLHLTSESVDRAKPDAL